MLNLRLSIISDWGRRNLVSFNASKTQFLHLSTRQDLPHSYPLFFNNTQLSPSPILNCLGLSFSQNSTGNLISYLLLNQLPRGSVFCIVFSHFFPLQLLTIYRGPCLPLYGVCMPCVGRFNTYSSFGQGGVKGFSSHQIPSSY